MCGFQGEVIEDIVVYTFLSCITCSGEASWCEDPSIDHEEGHIAKN